MLCQQLGKLQISAKVSHGEIKAIAPRGHLLRAHEVQSEHIEHIF